MGVMQGCCWVANSIVPIVSNVFSFFTSVVHGAWPRQAPRYVLCVRTTCILCHEFVACANVLIC